MTGRTSTAVMARRAEPADSLDFFPTPPWATRAFCEHVLPQVWFGPDTFQCSAFDPACGEGHMAVALHDYFPTVHASDIFDYGFGHVADFLHPDFAWLDAADWYITNPPFNLALEFIQKALLLAKRGVAMLVRTQFQEGEERFRELFSKRPPQWIFQFVERVPMHKARWVINGKTATAYQWFVWLKHPSHRDLEMGTRFRWIPKSRVKLSRHDDWLNFGGCVDLAKTHPVMMEIERRASGYREPVLTLAQVRAEAEPPVAATLGDIAAQLQRRLI